MLMVGWDDGFRLYFGGFIFVYVVWVWDLMWGVGCGDFHFDFC